VRSVHETPEPARAVAEAEAVFVGGGNTFRLLKALWEFRVLDAIRERVASGMPYLGSSAGSIVAGPTIRTTKDMPIVQPPSFEALGLVEFQISPHFLDPDPASRHMGETQEERISQFHEEADVPVAGLREGAMLRVTGASVVLKGGAGARLFRRGASPLEARPVEDVGAILKAAGARP
jgi:dipeptidase E